MREKIGAFQWDEVFSDFAVVSTDLVLFRDFNGYEIRMEKDDVVALEWGILRQSVSWCFGSYCGQCLSCFGNAAKYKHNAP